MSNLRAVLDQHGVEAEERAKDYANVYAGRRAAMVFDVVASRQRRYLQRVLPMVERYEASMPTLSSLAANGPGQGHSLRHGEPETMQAVAAGLLRFATDYGLAEEDAVKAWADGVDELVHAIRLDPYVGSVSGIGPALFAYLRMRCGADALKPDLRVHRALVNLGFLVPREEHALLVASEAVASELGISRLVLDQLLWWSGAWLMPLSASSARANSPASQRAPVAARGRTHISLRYSQHATPRGGRMRGSARPAVAGTDAPAVAGGWVGAGRSTATEEPA
ncbi:hypothetical protein [Kribbella kalugense]|nr:hypothetical protein [Kribbella kalugense]